MSTSWKAWKDLTDGQLLAQCEVDTYRASGPGGQKRNKTSSAIRLRHVPTGLKVIAEESRSQHENRQRALRRLRESLYLKLRVEISPDELLDSQAQFRVDFQDSLDRQGRLNLGKKDPRFWPTVGIVLDVFQTFEGRLAETSEAMNISTGNLVDFFQMTPKVWEQANQIRTQFGHKPLRNT